MGADTSPWPVAPIHASHDQVVPPLSAPHDPMRNPASSTPSDPGAGDCSKPRTDLPLQGLRFVVAPTSKSASWPPSATPTPTWKWAPQEAPRCRTASEGRTRPTISRIRGFCFVDSEGQARRPPPQQRRRVVAGGSAGRGRENRGQRAAASCSGSNQGPRQRPRPAAAIETGTAAGTGAGDTTHPQSPSPPMRYHTRRTRRLGGVMASSDPILDRAPRARGAL